jgi:membrane-associated protease RseP (regulator of RpoE activity)
MMTWFSGLSLGQKVDFLSAVAFVVMLCIFLYLNREKLAFQKFINLPIINLPIMYMAMLKTKVGLNFMDKISSKYREQIKLFGYIALGLGFAGMVVISLYLVIVLLYMVAFPEIREYGVSLVVPFTNIPGVGYLSFWYFILSIFIIVVMHEFAHGVVARAHNLPVRSSGLAVMGIIAPILPAAFVEPDEEGLKKREDIVQYSIYAAGPIINIVFGLLILFLFFLLPAMAGLNMEQRLTEPAGVSFRLINSSTPAALAGMANGTVITAVNGKEINDSTQLNIWLIKTSPGQEITVTANGTDYKVTTIANPGNADIGFIGINNIANERHVKPQYKSWADIFFWLKGLMKWLWQLSIGVGLFNLLPMMIVDGGRMLQVALSKNVKSRKKAKKTWAYIGIAFLLVLVVMLALRYAAPLSHLLSGLFGG